MARVGKNDEQQNPRKMEHFVRYSEENSQKALKKIIEKNRRINKKSQKSIMHKVLLRYQDAGAQSRCEEALWRSFQSVIEMYKLTEKTSSSFSTADIWAALNMCSSSTLEHVEMNASIVLGAAIWLLDNVEDRFQLIKVFDGIEVEDDFALPQFFDLQHDSEVIETATYVIKKRYAGEIPILTSKPEPGKTYDAFHQFLEQVEPQRLRRAIAALRSVFWKSMDCFFEAEYALGERAMKAIAEYNRGIDRHNKQIDVLSDAIDEVVKWREAPKKMQSGNKPLAGSPMMAGHTSAPSPLNPFQVAPLTAAFGEFFMPPQDDPAKNLERQSHLFATCVGKIEDCARKVESTISDIYHFAFEYSLNGFSLFDASEERYPDITLPIPEICIKNPYELCAGIVLLCSPTAMEKLYKDVKGANLEKDLDLPWLMGAFCGVAMDITAQLPWGIREYDEDEVEFHRPRKPLAHPDWYARSYQQGDDYSRSLAQILYETTGAILPRDMNEFDDAHKILSGYGIRGKTEVYMTELMTVVYNQQYKTHFFPAGLFDDKSDAAEDAEALREQVKKLREQLKKVTDDAHTLDRRARKAEQALQQEKAQIKEDRQELAALREVLFKRENPDNSEENVSVTFPYEVKRRVVVYGGHDSWLKSMKEYLTGDIRYIDRDQAIIDRNVIRNAETVWMQTNSLSHRQFYAIIDEVRKCGVPVRYFLYASAKKCAEQIALDEM